MAYIVEIQDKFYVYYADKTATPTPYKRGGKTYYRYPQKTIPCGELRANAEMVKAQVITGEYFRKHGILSDRKQVTVQMLFDHWMEDGKRNRLKATTLRIREFAFKAFDDKLKGRLVTEITRDHIKAYDAFLRKNFKIATANMYLRSIRTMWSYAVREGFLPRTMDNLEPSPAKDIKEVADEDEYERALTEDEVDRILKAAGDYHSDLLQIIQVAIYTGIRKTQLLGLHSDQVVNFTITGISLKKGGKLDIPIHPDILHCFTDEGGKLKQGLIWPGWDPIPQPNGISTTSRLDTAWGKIKKKAKIKGRLRFHDLRHNCARLLLASGWRIEEIQAWLGHKNLETTQRYAKWAKSYMIERVKATPSLINMRVVEAEVVEPKGLPAPA